MNNRSGWFLSLWHTDSIWEEYNRVRYLDIKRLEINRITNFTHLVVRIDIHLLLQISHSLLIGSNSRSEWAGFSLRDQSILKPPDDLSTIYA